MTTIKTREFLGIIQDIISTSDTGNRKFCFILGAGASRNSNIATGAELAEKWFQEIEKRMSFGSFKLWVQENQIDEKDLAAKYPQIYLKRFENDKQSAFDFLYEAMRDATPSIGYAILAQIMANTKNNVVITTNFDFLVEQSLYYYTSKKPLICGHESLSSYARPYTDRPLIIKIHRDLFYNPFSEPGQVADLVDNWKKPLRKVFDQYIPIVMGYAGNDGSLMKYLSEAEFPDKFFWCYRKNNLPGKNIEDLLSKHADTYMVEIPGFDEIMFELLQIFKLDLLDGIIKKRFEMDVNKLAIQYTEISQRLSHEKTAEDKADMVDYMINDKQDPASIYLYIKIFVSEKTDKLSLINRALKSFSNHPLLLLLKAQELLRTSQKQEAENVFNEAIDYGSGYPIVLNEYANYLASKKDFDRAETYYDKSLALLPNEHTFLLNYANFLTENKRNIDLCEILYKHAMKYKPDLYTPYFHYAIFLLVIRKEKQLSLDYFARALGDEFIDTYHKLGACSQLVFFGKHVEAAIRAYKSVTIEEKMASDFEAALLIMRDYSAIEKNLLAKLDNEPLNPEYLIKAADYYLSIKKDNQRAMEFYNLLQKPIGDDVLNSVPFAWASLQCKIEKNYDEAIRIMKLQEPSGYVQLGIIYKNHLLDFDTANSFYKKYLARRSELEPFFDEFMISANLADLYFYFGKIEEGESFLDKAFTLSSDVDKTLCLWFYRFLYLPKYRAEALTKIYYLLECGVRNPKWTFECDIARLESQGHPDILLIRKLGKRITECTSNPVWHKIEES